MKFVVNHAPGAGSTAPSVDQQSSDSIIIIMVLDHIGEVGTMVIDTVTLLVNGMINRTH